MKAPADPNHPRRFARPRGCLARGTIAPLAIGLLLVGVTVMTLTACTARIVPPPVAAVNDPRTVYVVDHGRTSSIVLPTNGRMVRYAYGEHRWYALEEEGFFRMFPTLLWPTQATLGRNVIDAPASERAVREHVYVGIEQVHAVQVDAERVHDLRQRLQARFDAGERAHGTVVAPARDLVFVKTEPRYHLFYNSNHATAEWLEALGCTVRGPTILSKWRVDPPPDARP